MGAQLNGRLSAAGLEAATQRRIFLLVVGTSLFLMAAFGIGHAVERQWDRLAACAAVAAIAAGGGVWGWRTQQVRGPMRVLAGALLVMLGWRTLEQGASLPAAGWWLSVLPFVLAGAGLYRLAVVAVVFFVAIVTVLHFGPDAAGLGITASPVGPLRQYAAVVGSEFLALGFILTAMWRRQEAAQALEEARSVAVDAVAAKERFLAHMSHEIRTPLSGIISTAELLRLPQGDEGQRAHLLGLQEHSARTLLGLVNDVLDWSKLEAGKVTLEARTLNLRRLVFETNELFAVQAYRKGIELTSSCNPDVPRQLVGDATRLRQILDNLVGNAIKFTSQGCVHIHLSLEAGEAAPGSTAQTLHGFRVEVADSGIGIDPDRVQSLFTAFTQADASVTRRYGGTGLGLAISAELARLMGGRIDVVSSPGRGSTFALVVPLEVVRSNARKLPAQARGDVVLASGSPGVQRHLETILHDLGIEPLVLRELAGVTSTCGCRLLLVDAPLLAALPSPRAWLQRQAQEGRRVVVIKPLGADLGVELPEPVAVLYKPVRRRAMKRVLDAFDACPGEPPAHAQVALPLRDHRPHVLVAEDNTVNQIVVQAMLAELGATCTMASTGSEALQCLARERFDLVLMDMQMPVMDGLSATRALRASELAQRARRTRVVAMTAQSSDEQRSARDDAGIDGFLAKPFGMNELREVLLASAFQRVA